MPGTKDETRAKGASLATLPGHGGTYVLVMHVPVPFSLLAGRLGERVLENGWYLYVGSAFGPGGLAARCGRHARTDKPMHWHIDYLREHSVLSEVWYRGGPHRLEHAWADILAVWKGNRVAWPGFGASDCRCPSHLWYRRARPRLAAFREAALDGVIQRLVVKGDRA